MPFRKAKGFGQVKPPVGVGVDWGHPLGQGLVHAFPLHEGAGAKVANLANPNYHGAVSGVTQGASSGWGKGRFGPCFNFDGSDDAITTPSFSSFSSTQSHTYAAWVKYNNGGTYVWLINAGTTGSTGSSLVIRNNNAVGFFYQGSNGIVSDTAFPLTAGTWYHVAVVYNGVTGTATFYVNGKKGDTTAGLAAWSSGATPIILGQWATGSTYPLSGSLDFPRIYNRALSPSEVRELYSDPFAGLLSPRRRISSPAPSSVGTATLTQDAHTLSSAGALSVAGTLAKTQADQTLSADGLMGAVTGSAAITQADQTLSSAGLMGEVTGSASITQSAQTLSAAGNIGAVTGDASLTQADQTLSATGSAPATGSASNTQADQTLSATGVLPFIGSAAITQADQTLSATATTSIAGAAAITQANHTLSATGTAANAGTLAQTQADQTLSAAGAVSITGSAAITQASQRLLERVRERLLHRLGAPQEVAEFRLHRLAAPQEICESLLHRLSNTKAQAMLLHRLSTCNQVRERLLHRVSAGPPDILVSTADWAGPEVSGHPGFTSVGEYELAWKTGIGTLEPSLSVWTPAETFDLGEAPTVLQVTHSLSAPIQWQLTIMDYTGDYHPDKVGGPWEGVLTGEAYDADDAFARKLIANINWGGAPYELVGIPTNFGSTRSFANPGKMDLAWSGVDASARFFRRGQSAATLRTSRGGSTIYNTDAIEDVCGRLGMAVDTSKLRRELLRVQHRQDGRWGDFFQAALDLSAGEWGIEGETLHCFQANYAGPVQWDYDLQSLIQEDSLDVSAPEVKNVAVPRRANEGGKSTGQQIDVNTFGEYSQTFSPPLDGVQWRFPATPNGAFSDLIFRNAAGNVIAVRNVRGSGPWPSFLTNNGPITGATSVKFTWGAPYLNPDQLLGAAGSIEFYGATRDQEESADPVYTVRQKVQASIDKYGEQPQEFPPNPLFYDSASMYRWLVDWFTRNAFPKKPATYRAPLNHQMRPNHCVRIRDLILNRVDVRYVKVCTHSFSDFPEQRFTRFSTVLYPSPADLVITNA